MTRYHHPRLDALRGGRPTRPVLPWMERLFHAIGANPTFTDSVLGDLAEERARLDEKKGRVAAGWWYLREALRSAPHLMWNAVRHGGARGRARVATLLAAAALVTTVALMALLLRNGPPARLVIDGQHRGDARDGIVLNTTRPVQLTTRALDAEGHVLSRTDVQYRRTSGMPLLVSPQGVVTCAHAGDATVRASVGTVATNMLLHCRPVKRVRAGWVDLIMGDSGQDLRFIALAPDGQAVTMLAGELSIEDSTIATLKGSHVSPVAPGRTFVGLHIGDGDAGAEVNVFEPVHTLEGLRRDQRWVVAPVRLAAGDAIHWPLPKGIFSLRYEPVSSSRPLPTFAVDGAIMCIPDIGRVLDQINCLVREPGASLRIAHSGTFPGNIMGRVKLGREPEAPPAVPSPRRNP